MKSSEIIDRFIEKNSLKSKFSAACFYKSVAELLGIVVKIDKCGQKFNYNRFYDNGSIFISLSARMWKFNNWKNFIKYTSVVKISLPIIDESNIKWTLVSDIYENAIKNLL